MKTIQEKILIPIGNFFFRWRDTAFSLIFAFSFYLVQFKELGLGDMTFEIAITVAGFIVALSGQATRAITIGYAYIKRGGLNKKIYADRLVVEGMFNHARNPLYTGNLLILFGGIMVLNLTWYYIVILPFFYIIYISITLAEEKFLKGKFGDEYLEYMKKVNRFVPHRFSHWNESVQGMDFTWKRLIKKEHNTTFILFSALLIFTVLKFHFRYDLSYESLPAMIAYAVLGIMVVLQIVAVVLKKTSRLEWDPDRL